MEDPVATSQLLDGEFNGVYLHLLWFLAAPVLYLIAAWIHRQLNNPGEATWVEKLLGGGDEESPGFLSFLNVGEAPALAPGALGVSDPPQPKPPPKPSRVFELFQHYPAPWAVAGEMALSLHRNEAPAGGCDIEIAVLRRDHDALWDHLVGWQPHYPDPADKAAQPVPWRDAVPLGAPVNRVLTRPLAADFKALTVLLMEADGSEWYLAGTPRVRLPLERAILTSPGGIPYLAPEIVLLGQAVRKQATDDQEFKLSITQLAEPHRDWLLLALGIAADGRDRTTGDE